MTNTRTLPLPVHFDHSHIKALPYLLYLIKYLRYSGPYILCFIGACSLPIIIPYLHLGIVFRIWDKYLHAVDKATCYCSCWDTGYKGNYETGIAGYKHVYFNLTANTFKIWTITVLFIVALYETFKRLINLVFKKKLRISMFILLASVIYPHYYSWWMYFNYWNDEYYRQWNHQLFFSITEIISTGVVINLLDAETPTSIGKLLVIFDIAVLHILLSGVDQFFFNVIAWEGSTNQIMRDLNLMFPDILHVLIPIFELKKLAKSIKTPPLNLITNEQFVASVMFVLCFCVICSKL